MHENLISLLTSILDFITPLLTSEGNFCLDNINFSPAASAALDSFSPREKKTIIRSLNLLSSLEPYAIKDHPKINKLVGQNKYFSLRASKDLRIIFEYSKEQPIIILDIVRHSTINRLFKRLNDQKD